MVFIGRFWFCSAVSGVSVLTLFFMDSIFSSNFTRAHTQGVSAQSVQNMLGRSISSSPCDFSVVYKSSLRGFLGLLFHAAALSSQLISFSITVVSSDVIVSFSFRVDFIFRFRYSRVFTFCFLYIRRNFYTGFTC